MGEVVCRQRVVALFVQGDPRREHQRRDERHHQPLDERRSRPVTPDPIEHRRAHEEDQIRRGELGEQNGAEEHRGQHHRRAPVGEPRRARTRREHGDGQREGQRVVGDHRLVNDQSRDGKRGQPGDRANSSAG
jgi:hypothetical protein